MNSENKQALIAEILEKRIEKFTNDQREAIKYLDGNILVSASAGSGKTAVMIERLIRIICGKRAGVKQVLAVTFTEKAASEMKEKLKNALTEVIKELDGDKDLANELQELPTADISTMHSFCSRLIRAYFYEVGLAPDYRILDGEQAKVLKDACLDQAFKEFYKTKEAWFKRVVDRYAVRRSNEEFKKQILAMYERGTEEVDRDHYLKQADITYTREKFELLLKDFKGYYNTKALRIIEKLRELQHSLIDLEGFYDYAEEVIDYAKQTLAWDDVYLVKNLNFPKNKVKYKLAELSEEEKKLKEKFGRVRGEFKNVVGVLTDKESDFEIFKQEKDELLDIFKIVKRFEEIYISAKREDNALDFADLEYFTLKILENEQIRKEISQKYKFVFVDEYQDTNAVQEAILLAITKDNLFMVGDAKQSIYGFRGCRPEIFLSKLKNMSKNGEKTVVLKKNFRSCDAVINFVNNVFSFSMTEKHFGLDYSKEQLERGNDKFDTVLGSADVRLLKGFVAPKDSSGEREGDESLEENAIPQGGESKKEQPRIYDVYDEADKIRKQIKDGEYSLKEEYGEPALIAEIIREEQQKGVKAGDICVLTRKRDNDYVKAIVNGLIMRGVPVVSEVKENVCAYPEISQMINVLKLIDCFKQDIPLAVSLKSAVGNFTDEDLAEIVLRFHDDKLFGSFHDAFMHYIEVADTPLSARLKEFYEYIEKIRLISDFVGAYGALQRIIADKDIEQNLYAEMNGKLKVKRLNRFIAESLKDGKSLSVKEFLDRIENYPESFGLADGVGADSVRVMTIHASKGLEFPVVIVTGLDHKSSTMDERQKILFDREYGFSVKKFNDEERICANTMFGYALKYRLAKERVKEELRVFYVALTRAINTLHLTFCGAEDTRRDEFNGAERFLDYIPSESASGISLVEREYQDIPQSFASLTPKPVTVTGSAVDKAMAKEMQSNFAFEYAHKADTELPLKNSVTKASELTEQTSLVHVLFDGEGPDVERGNIAHKIMEYYDFKSGVPFTAQVNSLVDGGIITAEQAGKIDLNRIEKAVSAPVFELIKDKTLYREKDFIVNVESSLVFDTKSTEKVLLQGIIDLLAVGKDGAVIIDYKYSSLEINSLKAKYKKQLDLYAHALKISVGMDTKKKILVNLFTGEATLV